MKFFLLAFFVAAVAAAPRPLDDDNQAVEVIVNGVPEGTPLELGGIVDINLKEHVEGQLVASSDLLHPYTAVGLAQAAAAAAAAEAAAEVAPSDVNFVNEADAVVVPAVPTPVEAAPAPDIIAVQPVPDAPVVPVPAPVVPLPAPESLAPVPETPVPVPQTPVLPVPAPEVPVPVPETPVPSPVAPVPEAPVVAPEAPIFAPAPEEPIPAPANLGPAEIYNDGLVQVQVNAPGSGVFSTLQNWFNLVVNYFNGETQVSHQIV